MSMLTQKINTFESERVFVKFRKVNQACQSIWPAISKEEIKVKFESVSAGIPNISHTNVSASSVDKENDKRIYIICRCGVNKHVGKPADAKNDKISL